MSISRIQLQNKKEKIKSSLLKKGIQPNNYEINQRVTEFFETKTLGLPYYSPARQTPYDASNKEAFNHNFKTFGEDIETVYLANIEANNRAVAMQEYYDTEKNKIINAITKLSLRVDNINEIINTSNSGQQFVESFDDYYGIDFYGDKKRNIPYTTSFIDLLQKKVYTEKTNSNVNKINITKAKITMNRISSYPQNDVSGEITNLLNDTLDSVYIFAERDMTATTSSIELFVDLEKMVTLNTVLFDFTSSNPMRCLLSLSEDGENFLPVYDFYGSNLMEWNFPTKEIRYFKITCTKQEPDGVSVEDAVKLNEFYYVLKNISIANEQFESKSVLVTKPIHFKNLVSFLKLKAKEMLFNHTRIDYFIGFDNGYNKIGWDKIENGKEFTIPLFEKKEKIANFSLPHFSDQDAMANSLYQLYELPGTANRNKVIVTPGYNMWAVKRYTLKSGHESMSQDFDFYHFDFSTYTSQCVEDTLFMDCENYDKFSLCANVMYVFTQYVEVKETCSLYNKFIRVVNTEYQPLYKVDQEKCYQKIFLNGAEISPTNNWEYSFTLKPGMNKIQVAVFSTAAGVTNRLLYHNLNFRELTNNVYAFQPMKFVNWAVLQYQMQENYAYYTIKDNKIFVKADPNDMIRSGKDDMGYFISYHALKDSMASYFKANEISFRIMAVLNSDSVDLSPELINLQITGK